MHEANQFVFVCAGPACGIGMTGTSVRALFHHFKFEQRIQTQIEKTICPHVTLQTLQPQLAPSAAGPPPPLSTPSSSKFTRFWLRGNGSSLTR